MIIAEIGMKSTTFRPKQNNNKNVKKDKIWQ